ncbi:SGNH/GDSL hydrolase family protein [Nostoc sp. FACHB-110]|uniref:SGNH/GDSL hydrolase family protein n=1 Tax=Nostoc sp. FACHB-110 TaxID=2692834 RepID=UPI0016883D62|nr:SGNH/GDSL hydrolase family protein [Nostoc sp. FACHB-110]MBD2436840.1 SGNH/GDSL hydrolase family protein [Nostoc sp. FACHB-110]
MTIKNWFLTARLAFLVLIMVLLTNSLGRTQPITQLYVFGDSLSDAGMVFQSTGGMYPPSSTYFQGRYSNGRVWIEYLADRLHLNSKQTNNFAYGGATTGNLSSSYVPSLLTQVQSFTQTHQKANQNALYVVWAGANDYLQGVNNSTYPVENVTTAIASLTNVGAKKILVGNLPDLGKLPATSTNNNAVQLSALTQTHNQSLRRSLKVLTQQHSDLEIVTLDAHKLYQEAINHPSAFGLSNVTSACLASSQAACSNPDKFLFWDGIHPTTTAHQIIADTAFAALTEAGIIQRPEISHQG